MIAPSVEVFPKTKERIQNWNQVSVITTVALAAATTATNCITIVVWNKNPSQCQAKWSVIIEANDQKRDPEEFKKITI